MEKSGVRTYCSEPNRGRRNWKGKEEEQTAVYANRRRIRGERGKRLLRQRGERVERSFAHMYETGGMRRIHLRGHENIGKRLLIHAGAFNLGLAMRKITGFGTPRGMRGRTNPVANALLFPRFPRAGLRTFASTAKHKKTASPRNRRIPCNAFPNTRSFARILPLQNLKMLFCLGLLAQVVGSGLMFALTS